MTRTPEERAAMEWLDQFAATAGWRHQVKVIKRMLGEPQLPKEPSMLAEDDAISHLGHGVTDGDRSIAREAIRLYHNHLYRRLTAPATKTVQVWRCESAVRVEGRRWSAHVSAHDDKESAENAAAVLAHGSEPPKREFACIRVTGPHDQEIPA